MRFHKIFEMMALATAVAFSAVSCDFSERFVSKEALETSKAETREAREALQAVQENFAKQNSELNSILAELSELTSQTTNLQLSTEKGVRQRTMAEKIDNDLDNLKNRIDMLEEEANKARKLNKKLAVSAETIKTLRETIQVQENEIAKLRNDIAEKELTINRQSNVIAVQKDTISQQSQVIVRQEEALRQTVIAQTQMLYEAGHAFEQLADDGESALNVNGRKDKNKVRFYKKSIYDKAIQFYKDAASQNHPDAAARIDIVQNKIDNL